MQKQMSKKGVLCEYINVRSIKRANHHKHFPDLVFRNLYFVIVIFNIRDRDCIFLVVKFPFPENRFLFTLMSFTTYKFFPGPGWLFPVSTFKEKYFNEKMRCLAGLNTVFQFLAKVPILAVFDYLGPNSK